MSTSNQSYIERANQLFANGKYKEAELGYEHAGVKLGMHLVEANIWMCKKRQAEKEAGTIVSSFPIPKFAKKSISQSALETQLAETQSLVEKYYSELQNLRFEKMDNEKQ